MDVVMPERVLDLHTHLFNARYLPLEGIIAAAMKKETSRLARVIAKLLVEMTGSSYRAPDRPLAVLRTPPRAAERAITFYLDELGAIVRHELLQTTRSLDAVTFGLRGDRVGQSHPAMIALQSSSLYRILSELESIDFEAEGWTEPTPEFLLPTVGSASLLSATSLDKVLERGMSIARKGLWICAHLMDRKAWGALEDYLEFFFTILQSEEDLVAAIFDAYGPELPPLQIAHYMMDMQLAYKSAEPPFYSFRPTQLIKMHDLQRAHPGRVLGFAAFDPRRNCEETGRWQEIAKEARERGFLGFKFYPAMGYKPSGNPQEIQEEVDRFFDYCVELDLPVFAHCTPAGFQTLEKKGANAHPDRWRAVLENPRWSSLRLCLGHAGGGFMKTEELTSPGWMAESASDWQHPDNFARLVAELCTTYPNVYCEFGYITELLEAPKRDVFVTNLERVRQQPAEFEFLDKVAYGSDWHMPSMVDSTRRYLQIFLEIFSEEPFAPYREGFFWKNGYRYLNLGS